MEENLESRHQQHHESGAALARETSQLLVQRGTQFSLNGRSARCANRGTRPIRREVQRRRNRGKFLCPIRNSGALSRGISLGRLNITAERQGSLKFRRLTCFQSSVDFSKLRYDQTA